MNEYNDKSHLSAPAVGHSAQSEGESVDGISENVYVELQSLVVDESGVNGDVTDDAGTHVSDDTDRPGSHSEPEGGDVTSSCCSNLHSPSV